MTRYPVKARLFAACLSALAGYTDAIGFLGTGGFFVSFMSGNSTRLGVGLAMSGHFAAVAGVLVAAFVCGVFISSLLGRIRVRSRQRTILLAITLALAVSAAIAPFASPLLVFALVAFAMGAVNMIFETDGEVQFGVTYMTGTLVKIGQKLAAAVSGGDRWAWTPFVLLWSGLIGGGVLGAFSYGYLGVAGLWPAACAAAALAIAAGRIAFPANDFGPGPAPEGDPGRSAVPVHGTDSSVVPGSGLSPASCRGNAILETGLSSSGLSEPRAAVVRLPKAAVRFPRMVSGHRISADPVPAHPVPAHPVSVCPVIARPVSVHPVSAYPVITRPGSANSVSAYPVSMYRGPSRLISTHPVSSARPVSAGLISAGPGSASFPNRQPNSNSYLT